MIGTKAKALSLLLKCAVIACAAVGVALSAISGAQAFMGGGRVFMYFTIQSNIAIALVCAAGAALLLRGGPIPDRWYVIKYVFTVSITLTGAVFCFVLAPTLGGHAWSAQHVLTHVAVPLTAIADFLVTGRYGSIKKRSVVWVTLPPLLYAVYTGIAYLAGWEFSPGKNYPYFFLNWDSPARAFGFTKGLPYMGCAWWILLILALLLAVGLGYLLLIDLMKKKIK